MLHSRVGAQEIEMKQMENKLKASENTVKEMILNLEALQKLESTYARFILNKGLGYEFLENS